MVNPLSFRDISTSVRATLHTNGGGETYTRGPSAIASLLDGGLEPLDSFPFWVSVHCWVGLSTRVWEAGAVGAGLYFFLCVLIHWTVGGDRSDQEWWQDICSLSGDSSIRLL